MVRHVLKVWPGHDLEETSVDRRWNAVWRSRNRKRCCTGRMKIIQVNACPQDLLEFLKRVAAFGHPRFVGRQVAGNNVWTDIIPVAWCVEAWGQGRTEVRASSQVRGRIGFLWLAKVGVSACGEIKLGGPPAV